jgi:acyl carrier protein
MTCSASLKHDDPIIVMLIGLWQRLLERTTVGPDDNFFDLGGDSLLAVALFAAIEEQASLKLPLTTIYDAPTPAALAAILNFKFTPKFSPIINLRSGKTFPPLFIVGGAGGNAMELALSARYVAGDRQVYGVQARGLDGVDHPHRRVEDMAEYCMASIRELQPRGPYLLAGLSFGGLVALATAHRPIASGEDVALLALLDTQPHPRF